MVRGACAALVGLPSDQVSEPFTIAHRSTSRAALRSCRPPSSPVPRVLAPSPWWPAGLGRLSGTRGSSPGSLAQLLSLVTPTLEKNELSFIFLCFKRQSLWVCLRIAVGWSDLAEMGVGGVVGGAQLLGEATRGGHARWLVGC